MTQKHAAVLRELAEANGAILSWQVSDDGAFLAAEADGVITLDGETDLFVHPCAVSDDDGLSYRMPKPDVLPLIALYKDFAKCIGREDMGSADEHTSDATLTTEQRAWLRAFVALWEVTV